MLRRLEAELPEEEIPPHDRLRFEVEHCGAPISTFENLRNEYAVLEIDDRYSPKIRLYGVASGKTGVMKLKKALFNEQPFAPGSILRLLSWERKPSYRFVDGKAKPNGTATDFWITGYEIMT